jgi:hypothetical protein
MRPHLTRWVVEPAPRGGRQLTVATRRASGRSLRSTNAHAQWPKEGEARASNDTVPEERGPLSHLIGDGIPVPLSPLSAFDGLARERAGVSVDEAVGITKSAHGGLITPTSSLRHVNPGMTGALCILFPS